LYPALTEATNYNMTIGYEERSRINDIRKPETGYSTGLAKRPFIKNSFLCKSVYIHQGTLVMRLFCLFSKDVVKHYEWLRFWSYPWQCLGEVNQGWSLLGDGAAGCRDDGGSRSLIVVT
jgi:hypothetical protein